MLARSVSSCWIRVEGELCEQYVSDTLTTAPPLPLGHTSHQAHSLQIQGQICSTNKDLSSILLFALTSKYIDLVSVAKLLTTVNIDP